MGEIKSSLASAKPSSLADYQALGDSLNKQLRELISGCTMKGAAHDELHVFLTEFMPQVGKLRKASDLPAAEAAFLALKNLSVEFGTYFT